VRVTVAIDGVKAKVARALEHLIELDDQMHEYLDCDLLGSATADPTRWGDVRVRQGGQG